MGRGVYQKEYRSNTKYIAWFFVFLQNNKQTFVSGPPPLPQPNPSTTHPTPTPLWGWQRRITNNRGTRRRRNKKRINIYTLLGQFGNGFVVFFFSSSKRKQGYCIVAVALGVVSCQVEENKGIVFSLQLQLPLCPIRRVVVVVVMMILL